jgi:hypothetical protein
VFLVGDELRCARCVTKPSFDACLWCGQPGSRRDSGPPLDPGGHPEGEVFCQPCWTIYVAYVEDVLERGEQGDPFRDLLEELRRVVAREHPDGA